MANKGGRPSKFGGYTAIYALQDPHGEVRYIGKSKAPASRMESHRYPGRSNQTPVAMWARKLRGQGTRPVMVILEWVIDWSASERRWIAHYKARGARLLNVTPGGYDMDHVTQMHGRFPAYIWVMKFCARTKRYELADTIRKKWAEVKRDYGQAGLSGYDEYLRNLVHEVAPLARL